MNKCERSTYQEFIHGFGHLVFGTRYGHYITCHFGTREVDFAIPLLFKLFNLIHTSNELSMIQAVDDDRLRDKLCVLYKEHTLDI